MTIQPWVPQKSMNPRRDAKAALRVLRFQSEAGLLIQPAICPAVTAEGGVVAFHVSNDYLNLPPAIALVARDAGMEARVVHSPAQEERGVFQSTWVLVSANGELWKQPAIAKVAKEIKPVAGLRVWTDDYSSLLPILKWMGQ